MAFELGSADEVLRRLTPIFRDVFDDDTLILTPGLSSADIPEWDSFNHINLLVAIEARFGVKFQTAELESVQNVGQLAGIIERKLLSQPGTARV